MGQLRSLDIRLSDLDAAKASQVLEAISEVELVRLRLDTEPRVDSQSLLSLMMAICRHDRQLSVSMPAGPRASAIAAGLYRTFAGYLLWNGKDPHEFETSSADLFNRMRSTILRHGEGFVVQPKDLSLHSRMGFQADLERLFRSAGIEVSPTIYGAVATIAFEAILNAEEHGSFDLLGHRINAPRFLGAQLHRGFGRSVAPSAWRYLESYVAAGHAEQSGWLELVIADGGVGIPYPSFHVFATQKEWSETDIFRTPLSQERERLERLLNLPESSKGEWGQVVNLETARGDGTRFIKVRLAAVRGYASIRTGRFLAEWWYSKTKVRADDFASLPAYEVYSEAMPLLRGTIWRVLVPLQTQLTLEL